MTALFLSVPLFLCSCGVVAFDFPGTRDAETAAEASTDTSETAPADNTPTDTAQPSQHETTAAVQEQESSRFAADEVVQVQTRAEREKNALSYFTALEKTDMNGATFFITCADEYAINPKYTTDALKKNTLRLIEGKYNVSLVAAGSDTVTMLSELKTAVNSGSYYSDLITVPLKDMGAFIASGMLMNIYSLPYLDLTAPYVDKSATMACSADKALYGVGGDMFCDVMKTDVLYCNKELLRSGGVSVTEMYDAVRTGNFTWDLFFEYTASVGAPFDETGADKGFVEVSTDSDTDGFTDLVFYSAGGRYIKTDIGKAPEVAFDFSLSGSAAKVFETVKNALSLEFYAYSDARAAFNAGVSLWYFSSLDALDEIASGTVNFGVLPLPKGDKSQGYVSVGDSETQVFAVPKNNNNYAEMSAVISSFLALGHRRSTVNTDEFVQNALLTSLRDAGSAASIERVFFTGHYDYTMTRSDADAQTRELLRGLLAE